MSRAWIRAAEIQGTLVTNPSGESLGEIKDVVLDKAQGRVGYAVLSFGGFLGVGKKLFALPWSALRYVPHSGAYVLDIDKESLKKAPGFSEDDWPDLADPGWDSAVLAHYRQR